MSFLLAILRLLVMPAAPDPGLWEPHHGSLPFPRVLCSSAYKGGVQEGQARACGPTGPRVMERQGQDLTALLCAWERRCHSHTYDAAFHPSVSKSAPSGAEDGLPGGTTCREAPLGTNSSLLLAQAFSSRFWGQNVALCHLGAV